MDHMDQINQTERAELTRRLQARVVTLDKQMTPLRGATSLIGMQRLAIKEGRKMAYMAVLEMLAEVQPPKAGSDSNENVCDFTKGYHDPDVGDTYKRGTRVF